MARAVEQSLRYCGSCRRKTLHHRNTKHIRWLMHLVLTIVTAGFWLFVWIPMFLWHGLTKPIGGAWTCSQCGG